MKFVLKRGGEGSGGVSDWLHTSIYFFKHPATPFKIISIFAPKMDEKKIYSDFIKGGRGAVSPFYEVISQKIFFSSELMASLRCRVIFLFFKTTQ